MKVRCVKRVLGQPWAAVQSLLPSLPFVAGPGPNSGGGGGDGGGGGGESGERAAGGGGEADEEAPGVCVRVGDDGGGGGAWVSPVAVSAAVAKELRLRAEAYLNDKSHRTFGQMATALRQGQGALRAPPSTYAFFFVFRRCI